MTFGRPRPPARVAALSQPAEAARRRDPFASIGQGLRRLLHRRPVAPTALDRSLGGAAVAMVAGAVLGHPVLGVTAGAVVLLAGWRARGRDTRRQRSTVAAALPDLVDLLVVAVGAGCTAERALRASAPYAPAPLAAALEAAVSRLDRGAPFELALEPLSALAPSVTTGLVHALVAAHHDGVPLEPALERLGGEARRRSQLAAAEAARRLPVRLLVPLVVCTLPAFALLTVVPVLVATLGRLR